MPARWPAKKGPFIRRERGPWGYNLTITLAGPLMNLAIGLLLGWESSCGRANLAIGVFNLLPAWGSDGARALAIVRECVASAAH